MTSRLITLPTLKSNKMLCEVFRNGTAEMALIQQFVWHDDSSSSPFCEPKVLVQLLQGNQQQEHEHEQAFNNNVISIDLGQVTTIWDLNNNIDHDDINNNCYMFDCDEISNQAETVPSAVLERILDRIHATTVRKGRKAGGRTTILTKNMIAGDVSTIVSAVNHVGRGKDDGGDGDNDDPQNTMALSAHVEQVLRKVQKTGTGFARLVDSNDLAKELFGTAVVAAADASASSFNSFLRRRALASLLLARDANQGGRFKRWPVVWVEESRAAEKDNNDESVSPTINRTTITLLNGGWLVLDQSVRAGLEAQKMVARSSSDGGAGDPRQTIASDDRIVRRLECLAMGETMFVDGSKNDSDESTIKLHLDVKQVLASLQLPCTSDGARAALMTLGYWSDDLSSVVQPWPKNVLEAATQYVHRRKQGALSETDRDRVDLSHLPCICIDAKGTTFRDDALGIRPRQSTGRFVNPDASKWEVLIHIVDVSDIYADQNLFPVDMQPILPILRDAAKSRGTSRYDLPFGPLHLLPPVVLQELGFSKRRPYQRCVSLWTYIDERNGRLLDAGIERTVVSRPFELTYQSATAIMSGKYEDANDEKVSKIRAVLLKIENILDQWSEKRRQLSESAQKRETRLLSKELASRQQAQENGDFDNDEMDDGFKRSQSHRLVDTALDFYSYASRRMLNRAKVPIPSARGAGLAEGGRVATAPLRRYIDGECQRQLLATMLGYGPRINADECRQAGKIANESRNKIQRYTAARKSKTS